MLVAIHQPHYLPWLRYVEKIARADAFIVLDNIQFNKNGWQNRNRIKQGGQATLLTVPIHAAFPARLDAVRIDTHRPWARKHVQTLQQAYARAPYFDSHCGFIAPLLTQSWEFLNDLNAALLKGFLEVLGIQTPIYHASALNVPGEATTRLINLIQAVGGNAYYSGAYALESYLDANELLGADIDLVLQSWTAPVYPQGSGEFLPDLSIVDMLAHCGPDTLARILGEP